MWARRILVLIAVVATIGCDRVTKHLADVRLAGAPPRTYLGNTVRLEYARNEGAFLGLGRNLPAPVRALLFTAGAAGLLIAAAIMASRYRWSELQLLALSAAWAGGVSNVVDRMLQGSVTDFLNVGVGPVRTGIFNVADVGITLGAIVLVMSGGSRRTEAPAGGATEPEPGSGVGARE
jgi:signal peptidase II